MPTEHIIKIASESSGGTEKSNVEVSKVNEDGTESSKTLSPENAFFMGEAISAAQSAANLAINMALYDIKKTFDLNDDYIGKRSMQVAETMINKTTSILGGFARGAVAGMSTGNPYLALFASLVSGFTAIANEGIQSFKAMDEQNIELRKQDAQLNYTRQRAGWSTHAGSIGEDL